MKNQFFVVTDSFAQQYGYPNARKLIARLRAKALPGYKDGKFWKVQPDEFHEAFKKLSNMGESNGTGQGRSSKNAA